MQNIYFCIYKTICFAQVYVFAYAKVYTLYKKYLVLHMQNNIILRMYIVLHAAPLIHKHAKTDFKYIVTISCALMMTIMMIMLTTKVFYYFLSLLSDYHDYRSIHMMHEMFFFFFFFFEYELFCFVFLHEYFETRIALHYSVFLTNIIGYFSLLE